MKNQVFLIIKHKCMYVIIKKKQVIIVSYNISLKFKFLCSINLKSQAHQPHYCLFEAVFCLNIQVEATVVQLMLNFGVESQLVAESGV